MSIEADSHRSGSHNLCVGWQGEGEITSLTIEVIMLMISDSHSGFREMMILSIREHVNDQEAIHLSDCLQDTVITSDDIDL